MSVQATNSSTHTPNTSPVILEVPSNSNVNGQVQTCSHNKKIGIGGAAGALLGGTLPPLLLQGKNLAYITAPFSPTYGLIILVMVGATFGSVGGAFVGSFVDYSNCTQPQTNSQMLRSAVSNQCLWKRFFKC